MTCSLREALIDVLKEWSKSPYLDGVVIGLPAGIKAGYVVPLLLHCAAERGIALELGQVVHVVDTTALGAQLAGTERCRLCHALGEDPKDFTMAALADADIVAALGTDTTGSLLVDACGDAELRRVNSLADLRAPLVFSTSRIKPAWGEDGADE
ncbi:MAG: hypothetical protein E7A62_04800 [Actinomycetaceae bacterium]|nr:hypothetical protein [Actinomycetaceae bacterium]MDU0970301.1 hypothetical protein [Actinomycetaceae bacterium]